MFKSFKKQLTALSLVAMIAAAVILSSFNPVPAHAQALSDYAENNLIDFLLRGETFTPPESTYVGLSTSACSDSSFGDEVSGGSYARVEVTSALTSWAGTQAASSTTASSGTGGQTSNNAEIEFPTPSASWGTVTHWFLADASTSGNILFCAALGSSKTINSGDTVSFAVGALTITFQ